MNIDTVSSRNTAPIQAPKPAEKREESREASPKAAAPDTVELSAAAKALVSSNSNSGASAVLSQRVAAMYNSASGLVSSNPRRARSSLQAIISQYPNSPEARKARVQLAQIPK